MDSFLLHKIASHLDFYQVWKLRELSSWCKSEIEKEQQKYLSKLRVELHSEEDAWILFPADTLVFKCVLYDKEKNIFKFELEDNTNTKEDNGCALPEFLKFWEKYCHSSIRFVVNSKPTRSYYTIAKQNSPTRNPNVWYKTDSIYYGLRTRLADYDFFVDFYRPLEVFKQLIANGVVRTSSTQSKLSLMQEDIQRIIKELKLTEQPVEEGLIYLQATPSFLFPQLSVRLCVFPDKLQTLQANNSIIRRDAEAFDVKSMDVVKWMAKNSTVSCSAI